MNRSIGCSPARTFRLASFSDTRFHETVAANLDCLHTILSWNASHGTLFFRITSDLIPFASHPVCSCPWQEYFTDSFHVIGDLIRRHGFRISMHPDQFVLLNTPNEAVLHRSVAELAYQVEVLDLMGLDTSAKVQIHVGGVYGNKRASMDRFVSEFKLLDPAIRARIAIENDERLYTITDCLAIYDRTGIPVIPDLFHHSILNNGEDFVTLLDRIRRTWKAEDGIPMVDYSSQEPGKRTGAHAEHIVADDFRQFLVKTQQVDFDIMLEIKDKERSALEALSIARRDPRLVAGDPGEG